MNHSRHPLVLAVIPLLLTALLAAGCGDDDGEPIVTGEGEIPSSFPSDFPLPDGARIGSTLVNRPQHYSEFVVAVPLGLDDTVRFFQFALVERGYVVDSLEGSVTLVTIEYSRGDLTGEINLTGQGNTATQGAIRINRS